MYNTQNPIKLSASFLQKKIIRFFLSRSLTVIPPLKASTQRRLLIHKQTNFLAGFTLLELLVVIAIIGLLASAILAQNKSWRAKSRDAKREGEIKTIQNALAIYVINKKNFPVYSGVLDGTDLVSTELQSSGAISYRMPTDPLNSSPYVYSYVSTTGSTYTLTYSLETNSIPGKSAGPQTASP